VEMLLAKALSPLLKGSTTFVKYIRYKSIRKRYSQNNGRHRCYVLDQVSMLGGYVMGLIGASLARIMD